MSHRSNFQSLSHQEKRIFLQALVSLPLVRIGLMTLGYRRLRRLLARAAGRWAAPRGRPASPDRLAQAAALMVHRAARTRLTRANCLPRSLTLWSLLRRQRIESDLCIGVQKNGGALQAHAWVEYRGRPLDEDPELRRQFALLARRSSATF